MHFDHDRMHGSLLSSFFYIVAFRFTLILQFLVSPKSLLSPVLLKISLFWLYHWLHYPTPIIGHHSGWCSHHLTPHLALQLPQVRLHPLYLRVALVSPKLNRGLIWPNHAYWNIQTIAIERKSHSADESNRGCKIINYVPQAHMSSEKSKERLGKSVPAHEAYWDIFINPMLILWIDVYPRVINLLLCLANSVNFTVRFITRAAFIGSRISSRPKHDLL